MKIIDLTMPIDENTPVYPGGKGLEINQSATISRDGWTEKRVSFNTHFSTHVDAPFHMFEDGKKVSDYDIEKFIDSAVILDIRNKDQGNLNLDIIKENDIVLLLTGDTEKAYNEDFFKSSTVLEMNLAQKLVEKKVKIVGIDSWTIDQAPYNVHKLLFKNDILIVENLVNLDKLNGRRFECFVMPLKIKGTSGAPCRVIGIVK